MVTFLDNWVLLFQAAVIVKHTFVTEMGKSIESDAVAIVAGGTNAELIGVYYSYWWSSIDDIPSESVELSVGQVTFLQTSSVLLRSVHLALFSRFG